MMEVNGEMVSIMIPPPPSHSEIQVAAKTPPPSHVEEVLVEGGEGQIAELLAAVGGNESCSPIE